MTGPLFETPPRITGNPIPRIEASTDRNGNALIQKQEWDRLMQVLEGSVLVQQREIADLFNYLERLTKFIADNYD